MLLIPQYDSLTHFSPVALMDLYHKLNFPHRNHILKFFLLEDVKIPKNNPPYSSSIFPEASKHCISLLSYLLGYSFFMYNYNQFLAENIHEQFMNFKTQGEFSYTSVIIHMFLFQQGDLLPIQIKK